MNNTIVGADLAKEIIQVCIYTNKKVHSNKERIIRDVTIYQ